MQTRASSAERVSVLTTTWCRSNRCQGDPGDFADRTLWAARCITSLSLCRHVIMSPWTMNDMMPWSLGDETP